MSGEIETSQFTPLDANTQRDRRAAITCAAHILDTGGNRDDLIELLRAVGLAHDPHALVRDPIDTSTARPRGPQQ